jgi:hypothetical protein
MKSNLGPWNHYEIVKPKGVKKSTRPQMFVNGRPIFYDHAGNPIMTVHAPDKPIVGHMADHMTSGIEETKETPKDCDDDEFFDAPDEEHKEEIPDTLQILTQNITQSMHDVKKKEGDGAQ